MSEVVCFQQRHVVPACTHSMRKLGSGAQKPCCANGESGVSCSHDLQSCSRKCGTMCCSCQQGCAWACKEFSSAHSRCAVLRLLLQHLRVVMLGGFEHLAKRDLQWPQ